VLASAFAATVLSGEYQASWLYLLVDLGLAAVGVSAGGILSRFLLQHLRQRGAARLPENY
jgi:hypothetical protein